MSPVVVGVPRLTVALQLAPALAVTAAGHEMVTADPEETTVTKKSQLAPSALLMVTGVVPSGKNDPDAGLEVIVPQVPDVVALKLTFAPGTVAGSPLLSTPGPVVLAVTVIFPGQVNEQDGGAGLLPVKVVLELLLASR